MLKVSNKKTHWANTNFRWKRLTSFWMLCKIGANHIGQYQSLGVTPLEKVNSITFTSCSLYVILLLQDKTNGTEMYVHEYSRDIVKMETVSMQVRQVLASLGEPGPHLASGGWYELHPRDAVTCPTALSIPPLAATSSFLFQALVFDFALSVAFISLLGSVFSSVHSVLF